MIRKRQHSLRCSKCLSYGLPPPSVYDIELRGLTIIKNLEKQEGSRCHKGVGMITRSVASKTKGSQAHDFGKKYGKGPIDDTVNGSG
ncbi:unnamed protein product, partial [Ilex paraguariensis]